MIKTAICTCIKDEHLYLAEWIEWHRAKGFDHIYLFEDRGSQPHDEIVAQYDFVTLLPIDVVMNEPDNIEGRQRKMCYYSLRTFTQWDWLAFIDADEFVDFEEEYNLERLLNEYDDYPAIMLSWMLYPACGRIERPTCGVVEAYPTPDLNADENKIWFGVEWSIKSFVNMKHHPRMKHIHLAEGAVNMNGNTFIEPKVWKKAWIRHYYTKSWEEWVWRIMERGDLCNGNRKLAQFFYANPDMLHLKKELIQSVAHRIPHGVKNFILDEDHMIVAGGNVKRIEELNKKRL